LRQPQLFLGNPPEKELQAYVDSTLHDPPGIPLQRGLP
jgi:hypothetical protein